MLGNLVSTARAREKLGGISEMTFWRWRHSASPEHPFPEPVCINGRNYFWNNELEGWVIARAESNNPALIIPDAEAGRAKGRKKLSALRAAQNQPIDQLGHNATPPLDNAAKQYGQPVISSGSNKLGGENG
jgi:hypothetical protein